MLRLSSPLIMGRRKVHYLLRDEFKTPLTAGNVNGTGTPKRYVRDVESKIAIASDWCNFGAQATAVYAEEDLVYQDNPITRTPGRLVICKWKCTTDGPQYSLALVTSKTPAWNHTNVEAGFWRSAAGQLSIISNAALLERSSVFVADGTTYYLAIELEISGAAFFIKGGAYTVWTPIGITSTGSTATLYLAAAGNTAVFGISHEKEPALNWTSHAANFVSTGQNGISKCGPYAVATRTNGNVGLGVTNHRDFISVSQQYRIRQSGTVSQVKFFTYTITGLTEIYITFWRKNISGTYDLIGITDNLATVVADDAINTITLNTPVTGIQAGDYIGVRGVATEAHNIVYALDSITGSNLYYASLPGSSGFDWEAQSKLVGYALPVEVFVSSPQFVFIGDSIIAGHNDNYSFLESTATTSISSTIEEQFKILTGYTYQNMGIGSQTTTQIAARFAADVVALKPLVAVIEGGVNDISIGTIDQATFIANYTSMLDACVANNIKPVVITILPWTAGTTDQMNTRDTWNAALAALVSTYSTATLVDCSTYVGQFRSDGPAGNLWDIKAAYNVGNVHFNATGYGQIALALSNAIMPLDLVGKDFSLLNLLSN